jgi:hypothetical protein
MATLAMLSIGLAACGSNTAARSSSASDARVTSTTPAGTTHATTAGLEKFLLARGEEAGYQPSGSVDTISDAALLAGDGQGQTYVDRLRNDGFDGSLSRSLQSTRGAGITSLFLFRSAAGARKDAALDRGDLEIVYRGWTVKRFDVAGVPGGFGWTATRPGDRVGNIEWVEGRCVLTLGNAMHNGPASAFVGPLTAGVHAMHRRIAGQCP